MDQVGLKYELQTTDERILYRVMAGSYTDKANANRQVERLNKAGFNAVIMPYKA